MEKIAITAQLRKDEKVNQLRAENQLPAILYGPSFDSKNIKLDRETFRKAYRSSRQHQIIDLELDGKTLKVLVKDIQLDPVKDLITHVDFYVVEDKRKVIVPVPVEFTGESPALRVGAILTVVMSEIKIKSLAKDVPVKIDCDISTLKTDGDKIRVSDLKLAESIEIMADKNAMIAKAELSRAAKKGADEDAEEGEGEASSEAEGEEKAEEK